MSGFRGFFLSVGGFFKFRSWVPGPLEFGGRYRCSVTKRCGHSRVEFWGRGSDCWGPEGRNSQRRARSGGVVRVGTRRRGACLNDVGRPPPPGGTNQRHPQRPDDIGIASKDFQRRLALSWSSQPTTPSQYPRPEVHLTVVSQLHCTPTAVRTSGLTWAGEAKAKPFLPAIPSSTFAARESDLECCMGYVSILCSYNATKVPSLTMMICKSRRMLDFTRHCLVHGTCSWWFLQGIYSSRCRLKLGA